MTHMMMKPASETDSAAVDVIIDQAGKTFATPRGPLVGLLLHCLWRVPTLLYSCSRTVQRSSRE